MRSPDLSIGGDRHSAKRHQPAAAPSLAFSTPCEPAPPQSIDSAVSTRPGSSISGGDSLPLEPTESKYSEPPTEEGGHRRSWVGDLSLLLLAAGALRLALFSGFCLGDDRAYGSLVRQMLDGTYPAAGETSVFVGRPVLLGALSLGVAAGGWSELAIVAPILLASLVGIGGAYCLARVGGGRTAGWAAGLLSATLPLDVVHSTTLTNDILGTSICVLGLALTQATGSRASRPSALASGVGGLFVGLAAGVKLTFILAGPLILIGFLLSKARLKSEDRRLRSFALGWAFALLGIGAFFAGRDAGSLFPIRAELEFNHRYMEQVAGPRELLDRLLLYPRLLMGLRLPLPPGAGWSISGLTTWALLLSFPFTRRRREEWWNSLIVWIAGTLVFLEFWPHQLFPTYVPLHRLPRFLHVALFPMTILAGVGIGELLRMRGPRRLMALVLLIASVSFNLVEAARGAAFHRDSMSDLRIAWGTAAAFPGLVYSDPEMLDYLRFRSGYRKSERFLELGRVSDVPQGSLVIVGGSRRPELDPGVTLSASPPQVPNNWQLLRPLSLQTRPWRPVLGSAYLVAEPAPSGHDRAEEGWERRVGAIADQSCPGGLNDWDLLETIDVGDAPTERRVNYEILGETWNGRRRITLPSGQTLDDRGRAFLTSQSMDIPKARASVRLCIVKLVDARIWPQTSRWFLGEREIGVLATTPASTDFAFFSLVTAEIAGGPRERLREEVTETPVDVSSFLIIVMQSRTRNKTADGR